MLTASWLLDVARVVGQLATWSALRSLLQSALPCHLNAARTSQQRVRQCWTHMVLTLRSSGFRGHSNAYTARCTAADRSFSTAWLVPLRVLCCCPQEKVYSRSEVALVHEEAMQQAGYAPGMGLLQAPQAQQDLWQQQDQQQAAAAAQDDVAGIRRAKRHGALGSEHSLKHKHAAVRIRMGVSVNASLPLEAAARLAKMISSVSSSRA